MKVFHAARGGSNLSTRAHLKKTFAAAAVATTVATTAAAVAVDIVVVIVAAVSCIWPRLAQTQ